MSFKTRDPLTDQDDVPYLIRPADSELEALVKRIDYVALMGPRLSGKTSMLMRLWNQLHDLPRYVLAYVNLSLYSTLPPERWYTEMMSELAASAGGALPSTAFPIEDAIDFREAVLGMLQDQLANRILILMLDEVETVPAGLRIP